MKINSLAWRLTLPIIFVGMLMMLLGFAAAYYVHREHKTRLTFVTEQFAGETAIRNLAMASRDLNTAMREFLLKGDFKLLDKAQSLRAPIQRLIDESEVYVISDRGQELIDVIRAGETETFGRLQKARELPLPAMRYEVGDIIDNSSEPKLRKPVLDYLEIKRERVEEGLLQSEQFGNLLALSMIILGLCGATAGVLWGLAVARGIGRSLVQLTVPIKSVAGRLSEAVGPLTVQTHWKFDDLQSVVDQMAGQIGEVIEQMRASELRAERSEQLAAVGQLAAGMAHELRNPLTSMKLLVQTAVKKSVAGGSLGPTELNILDEEIERLERVVATILDYARPPRIHQNELDLVDVLNRTVELLRDRFRIRGVDLAVDLPATLCPVRGDAGQLRQVGMNLLINSLDASITGQTVTMRIASEATTLPGRGAAKFYIVEVSDEGMGLPKDLDSDIFDPFVSTKETGLGLGLTISRRIVEAHGGTIEAVDRPGGGAVVRVYLPVEDPTTDSETIVGRETLAIGTK